jgi:hypothetical protein
VLIGHYAVAFGAKKIAPKTSLGTLFAAGAFLDLLWPLLVLAGLETVRIAPGDTRFTPLEFLSYPWSHSLLTSVLWGIGFGLGYFALTGSRRGAIVLALLVVSHWFLDLVAHRPDLPLAPGAGLKAGLGLWNSVAGTLIVELGLFTLGIWLYRRATRARDGIGRWGLFGLVALLLAVYAGAAFGPPPPNVGAIVWTDNAQWLLILLAWWVDGHRIARPSIEGMAAAR